MKNFIIGPSFASSEIMSRQLWTGIIVGVSSGILLYAINRNSKGLIEEKKENRLSGGSVFGPAEHERKMTCEIRDKVDEASFESFPASDPPAY